MLLEHIAPGDKVAILPTNVSPPEETLEIGTVECVAGNVVRLTDNRMYSKFNRCGLTYRSDGYIEPATDAHQVVREWTVVEV